MIYGYIRVSTDKQTVENQRYEILKYASQKKVHIDQWVEETASGKVGVKERKLGGYTFKVNPNDILIVSELSRLGRNLMGSNEHFE